MRDEISAHRGIPIVRIVPICHTWSIEHRILKYMYVCRTFIPAFWHRASQADYDTDALTSSLTT